jgi:hypothetical protein
MATAQRPSVVFRPIVRWHPCIPLFQLIQGTSRNHGQASVRGIQFGFPIEVLFLAFLIYRQDS